MKNRKDDQCVEYLRGHPCDYEACAAQPAPEDAIRARGEQ